ncbi:hypothetical protein F53441_2722 [Fusarium austroafricanum]|uniref:Uncharacterized protein n=1 Tax=Fusarium austroafricanum TaxID=2364996 RepID=A0A8H4KPC4_9HYPO|nr:hypothetical protein F53441_2722 [Fusarium austroafricanum]
MSSASKNPNLYDASIDGYPPAYEPSSAGDSGHHRDNGNGSAADGSQAWPHDPRAMYAKQVQRACKTAWKQVTEDNALASSSWAAPLAAAPTAISVMAFLLKTAADKKAAGITVSDLVVKSEKGEKLGELPSRYFHTNLQHCSDVGRLAFLDAQQKMNKINAVARSMMDGGGSVSYIVELLEDPEDAKMNLKPELDEVKRIATDCREECESVKKKFEYWQHVIIHLSHTALDLRGEKIIMAQRVSEEESLASADVTKHSEKRTSAENKIREMKKQLGSARERVDRAQDELDAVLSLPPIEEPSYYVELDAAQRLAGPMTNAPKYDRGYLANAGSVLFGFRSKKYRDEDQAYQEAHQSKHERKQQEIIEEARARREAHRRRAENDVNEARTRAATLFSEIDQAVKELSLEEDKLADAKVSFAKASADLKRLGDQKLELNDIVEILRESTYELGRLKKQLEPLILFFSGLENNISEDVMKKVDAFLNTIGRNIRNGDNPDEMSLNLGKASKKRVLEAALQIQGRFSVIADISSAYVKISDTCIREAINRMELLSKIEDPKQWKEEREGFDEWCLKAIDDIHHIAKETSDHVGESVQSRIGMLERRAIAAAEEAAEDG